jgi:hypothetical protein
MTRQRGFKVKLKLHEKLDYKRWSEDIPGLMGKV